MSCVAMEKFQMQSIFHFLISPATFSEKIRSYLRNILASHCLHFVKNTIIESISDKFCQYDWGEKKNLEIYGQKDPPEYDLSLITAPVALYWSDNDWLAEPVVRVANRN